MHTPASAVHKEKRGDRRPPKKLKYPQRYSGCPREMGCRRKTGKNFRGETGSPADVEKHSAIRDFFKSPELRTESSEGAGLGYLRSEMLEPVLDIDSEDLSVAGKNHTVALGRRTVVIDVEQLRRIALSGGPLPRTPAWEGVDRWQAGRQRSPLLGWSC